MGNIQGAGWFSLLLLLATRADCLYKEERCTEWETSLYYEPGSLYQALFIAWNLLLTSKQVSLTCPGPTHTCKAGWRRIRESMCNSSLWTLQPDVPGCTLGNHFPSSSFFSIKLLRRKWAWLVFAKNMPLSRLSVYWKDEIPSKTYKSIRHLMPASFSSLFFLPGSLHLETFSSGPPGLGRSWFLYLECLSPLS